MQIIHTKTSKQKGVALITTIMLLIGITIVVLATAKTVLMETKITADNYRTTQATAAAQAAMDQAVAYFMAGGLDQDGTAGVDFTGPGAEPSIASCSMPATTAFPLTLTVAGEQTTYSQFYYDNTDDNACNCQTTVTEDKDGDGDGDCMTDVAGLGGDGSALITAKGWSDDCAAVRTITQCVGTIDIFGDGDGPEQPFVSRAGVGVFGNAKVINRYSNITIWSGGADAVHGAAYGTYIRPSGTEIGDYTTEQLDSSCEASPCNVSGNPGPNTQLVSNRDAGNGIDVITDDATLANLSANDFFATFFNSTRAKIKDIADKSDRVFLPSDSIIGETGLTWVDGNTNINSTDVIGTPDTPVILIIDGNLDKLNGGTIYGIVYVIGTLEIAGNPVVKGSVISENTLESTGNGTLTLVFKPWGRSNGPEQFLPGFGTIIAGSWKDW